MDERKATRIWLQRQFKTSGIQLDADALQLLMERVQEESCLDPEEYVHSLMEEMEAGKCRQQGPVAWPPADEGRF